MKKKRVDGTVKDWRKSEKMYLRTGGRFERATLLWSKDNHGVPIEVAFSIQCKRMVVVHLTMSGTYEHHDDLEDFTLYIEDKMSSST